MTISAIAKARASMFLDTAEEDYLTTIGRNYRVPRPPQAPDDDELYRCLIQILARLPKHINHTVVRLVECLFGTQDAIVAGGGRAWQIYEVNANEIILEVPRALIIGTEETASYMHGFVGAATTGGAASTDFDTPGDITVAASALSGLTAYVFYAAAWNAHTVSSASYNSGTDVSTVVTSAATLPALTGAPMFLDVPGDGVISYEGDFMAPDASEAADQVTPTQTVEHDRRVYLFGRGLIDIFEFYMNSLVRASGIVLRIEEI